jgi:nicotinamidase-related amidase
MLNPSRAFLLVVDIQGKLAELMDNREAVYHNIKKLIRGMQALDVPVIVAEQRPEKLGPTIPEIAGLLPGITPLAKLAFSCCGNQAIMAAIRELKRPQVVLAGIETHICIWQTAYDLLSNGYEVYVAADAVSSRTAGDRETALARMRDRKMNVVSTEMALFELLKTADHPRFRNIQEIVKEKK